MMIALYVEDLLLAVNDVIGIKWMDDELSRRFEMKDLDEAKVILGLDIHRNRTGHALLISQERYSGKIFDRFGMEESRPLPTPMELGFGNLQKYGTGLAHVDKPIYRPYREAFGCLMYLMIGTRPDLAFDVGKLSQHCEDPMESHWVGVKRTFRYVNGTRDLSLYYYRCRECKTIGYSDYDWTGCLKDKTSTSGYIFSLGDLPLVGLPGNRPSWIHLHARRSTLD